MSENTTPPTATPPSTTPSAAPQTLSDAMNLIAAERSADGKPITSGAILQALAEERYPDLVDKP